MIYDRSILSFCRENCYCPCCFVENLLIIIYFFLSEYFEVILLCFLWKYMYIKNKDKKKLNHHRRHFRWHCRTWTHILISSAVLCFGVGLLSKIFQLYIYSGGQYYALLKTTDQSKSQQPYDHNHDGPYCVLEVWGCPHGLLILPLFIEFW